MSAIGGTDPTFDPERRPANNLPNHIKHWSDKKVDNMITGERKSLDDATEEEWNEYHGKMKPWTDKGFKYPKMEINNDAVNHPNHYTNRSMEAIDIIEMIIDIEKNPKVSYAMSNVLKYMLRFRAKGKPIEDMKKARWYLDRMIKHLEEENA